MEPRDVWACADIIAADPIVGPRYERSIGLLAQAWRALSGIESFRAAVFEELGQTGPRVFGTAVAVFASDAFVQQLKTPPFIWIGPDLARRVVRGECPLLSNAEVRRANAGAGLNVVVWESCLREKDAHRPEAVNEVFVTFAEEHCGFRLKELISQGNHADAVKETLNSGGMLWDAAGRYVHAREVDAAEIVAAPHLLGLTAELALDPGGSRGSRMSPLFVYQPPRLSLRPGEQKLLQLACLGGTDEELAARRGISVSAVKKALRLIYERVGRCMPELGLNPGDSGGRGREKKQRLLAYLREHPEELRPIARSGRATAADGARPPLRRSG